MTTEELQKKLELERSSHIDTRIAWNNTSLQKHDLEIHLAKSIEEIERLRNLIPISWYDGYCKSGEKELAYDLLENFKKENNIKD